MTSRLIWISVLCGLMLVVGCSARPIKSQGTLVSRDTVAPESIEERTVSGQLDAPTIANLKELNKKAGRPTFGLIMGFYQLPSTMPGGAVAVSEGVVFGQAYRSFWLQDLGTKPFAVVPASPQQAEVLSMSMNAMLDAQIRFVEVSMADAVKVMQAEQKVIEGKAALFPGRMVPSGVDLLVSIQKGIGETGPIYVGRVIRTRDGRLLALTTQPDAGPYSLSPVINQLVGDTLRRLANE